jgi:hypothetical protein
MIALYTDFGVQDAYVGQMHAALARDAPGVPVIDLLHSAPNFAIRAAASLLPALAAPLPSQTVFVCVVDPGVGGSREPIAVWAAEKWFVGPDNGLMNVVEKRDTKSIRYRIVWRPHHLSHTFHGRDLFAPLAARLVRRNCDGLELPKAHENSGPGSDWPDEYNALIYIDHYGNAMTGRPFVGTDSRKRLKVRGRYLRFAETFSDVAVGDAFWYENAYGLVEIAMNQRSAAERFSLQLGDEIDLVD